MALKRKRPEEDETELALPLKKAARASDATFTLPERPTARNCTPGQLLSITWEDRHKLNLENRDFEPGELELGRTEEAIRITWLVEYSVSEELDSYIYFDNHRERYGGQFAFLSNFYPSKFTLEGHDFDSVEQYYQWKKAMCMRDNASPKEITLKNGEEITSYELADNILAETKANPLRGLRTLLQRLRTHGSGVVE